jgi:hypothetical protein
MKQIPFEKAGKDRLILKKRSSVFEFFEEEKCIKTGFAGRVH